MIEFAVKPPTIPIRFHKLLRIVAIVDDGNPGIHQLLEQLEAAHFDIETSTWHRRHRARRALGRSRAADARLLPRLRGVVQPFSGFNYEVQGVFQERVDGRIKFHTNAVRE